jgi:hypothetical protein
VSFTTITIGWDRALNGASAPATPLHRLRTNATPTGAWVKRLLTENEYAAEELRFSGLQPNRLYTFEISDGRRECGSLVCQIVEETDHFGAYHTASISVRTQALYLNSLPAPTNLHVCGNGSQPEVCQGTGVLLSWTDNATTEEYYEFQWAKAPSGTLPPNTTYTTEWLPPNQTRYRFMPTSSGTHYFRVRACNLSVCSTFSNVVQLWIPPMLS